MKKEKEPTLCPVCGEPTERELVSLRLSLAAGDSPYKFDFASDMKVCTNCRDRLSGHIRAWYREVNKTDIYSKYP